LGDVILTAPVYKNLKAHWPGCHVAALVKPSFAPALEGAPGLDEVLSFRGLFDALAKIRAGGFTHLLDLHGNLRSLLIRRLAGVQNVQVYRKDALARRLFVAFGLDSPALQKHTVERYLAALEAWGISSTDRSIQLGDYKGRKEEQGATNGPQRVLVLQSAFLGDCLLTLPLLRDLKALLPDCRLTVLTLEKTADVFRGSPWVDEVLLDDKRGAHGGLRGPWRLAKSLRGSFDLALIPHRSLRSALLARLAAIPRRIGFSSSAGRFFLTQAVPFTWLMHDLERNLTLLQPLKPDIRPRPDESVYVAKDNALDLALGRRLLQEGISPQETIVSLHPGSAWPTKRWLPERFSEVCRQLTAMGTKVILVGGPADRELCAAVAEGTGALNWCGQTTLGELKALMGRVSLFLTNDSGPMHMATACGAPTLALFGPTTRELGFFPYGPGHRVLEKDLACRPCGLHGGRSCPEGHFLCMRLISTQEVMRNVREMLGSS
jgi:heptosyltransferase-2